MTTEIPNKPLVSLVIFNLALNCLGRAYLLGKMLEPEFRIELVGFASGPTWMPCASHGWPEKRLDWPTRGTVRPYIRKLAEMAGGDIILACKAWPTVLDVAESAAKRLRSPRILDIDDWELGWFHPLWPRKAVSLMIRTWRDSDGFLRCWRAEARARRWPARLVSNRFLQNRFGGTYIPHACNTEALDPVRLPDRKDACRRLGLDPGRHWVGFVGSPQPHKGVDILLEAVALLKRGDLGVLMAGAEAGDAEITGLRERYGNLLEVRPPFARERLGEVLAVVDIVALPQRDRPAGRGQMPAKVFDAMSMQIPVVASAISDLPEVLAGCGIVLPPGDTKAFAEAIAALIDDPGRRRLLGEKGRQRCLERYSFEVVGKHLRQVMHNLLAEDSRRQKI